MIRTSEVLTTPPSAFATPLEKKVYETLETLGVGYFRIDNDPALTMEDCEAIDAKLEVKTVKTLLLCNRQQTLFYMFVTCGDKPFVTKDFGKALGISRVSFAGEEYLHSLLGTERGATTVYSMLLESSRNVLLVIDKDVLSEQWYGCTDGTTTCYMKILTKDLLEKILPFAGREPVFVEV